MSFPQKIAEQALLDSGRHCCICHKFCGFKIELHHIVQRSEGGEDTYDNCIPLCFDCHAEVKAYNPKHPKGRKYTDSELRAHRNRWYEKTKNTFGPLANPDYIELDRKLFTQIREILKSNGVILFLREHDYGGSFDLEIHDELEDFLHFCKAPEVEFLDIDMEGLRISLESDIRKFWIALGEDTFPLPGKRERNRIPRDPMQDLELVSWFQTKANSEEEFEELIAQQRKHIIEIKHKLNHLAQQVCNTYDEFIRLGRRKFVV
ncbi:MAG: HNH endonuclease [Chloroflexota bacterium]